MTMNTMTLYTWSLVPLLTKYSRLHNVIYDSACTKLFPQTAQGRTSVADDIIEGVVRITLNTFSSI